METKFKHSSINFILVGFGDLGRNYILPELWELHKQIGFKIFITERKDFEEFKPYLADLAGELSLSANELSDWINERYVNIKKVGYNNLWNKIGLGENIAYFAIPPKFYSGNLHNYLEKCSVIALEKPLAYSKKRSNEIINLDKRFENCSVVAIDHYLGKWSFNIIKDLKNNKELSKFIESPDEIKISMCERTIIESGREELVYRGLIWDMIPHVFAILNTILENMDNLKIQKTKVSKYDFDISYNYLWNEIIAIIDSLDQKKLNRARVSTFKKFNQEVKKFLLDVSFILQKIIDNLIKNRIIIEQTAKESIYCKRSKINKHIQKIRKTIEFIKNIMANQIKKIEACGNKKELDLEIENLLNSLVLLKNEYYEIMSIVWDNQGETYMECKMEFSNKKNISKIPIYTRCGKGVGSDIKNICFIKGKNQLILDIKNMFVSLFLHPTFEFKTEKERAPLLDTSYHSILKALITGKEQDIFLSLDVARKIVNKIMELRKKITIKDQYSINQLPVLFEDAKWF